MYLPCERLAGEDGNPYRIQIAEIPKVVLQVSEHRFHALACEHCGGQTRAWDEAIIKAAMESGLLLMLGF